MTNVSKRATVATRIKKSLFWLGFFLVVLHIAVSQLLYHIDYFHERIEKTFSHHFNAEVKIGQIQGRLRGVTPSIKIFNLTIGSEHKIPKQTIRFLDMSINIVQSVLHHALFLEKIRIQKAVVSLIQNDDVWQFANVMDLRHVKTGLEKSVLRVLRRVNRIVLEQVDV